MEREPLGARRRGIAPSGNPLFLTTCSRLVLLAFFLLGHSEIAQADVRITSITPSCAVAGDHVTLTGTSFGATNVTVKVGGVGATILSATGNLVKFTVPAGVPAGVTVVSAANPGEHAGTIALRIRGPEICGDSIDNDCDGQIDDPDVCAPVNHAPLANAGPDQTAPVGTTVHLDGSTSSDADGNLLTYQWTFLARPANSTATLVNPTSVTPTFTLDKAGDYTIQLIVNDGHLNSAPDTVTISTLNSAPVADAGPDQRVPVGTVVHLTGGASSDVDGDPLTYQWAFLTRPAGSTVTLVDPTSVTPAFTLDIAGDYIVQLLVTDGHLTSAPDTVTISTLNSPPVAEAGPDQTAHVGDTVTLDGSGSSDADSNPLTYQWGLVTKPAGSTAALTNPTTPQPRLTLDQAGTYVGQLVVNDGLANSAPDSVTINTLNSSR